MSRVSIVATVVAVCLVLAGPAGGVSASDDSRGLQRIPRLSYAAMLKNDHAKPRQRFKLRLFSRDTRPGSDLISASYHGKRSIAPYYGPNRAFDEWRVTRRKQDGSKLIAKLVHRLRKKGRVTFAAQLRSSGASSPMVYRCKIRGYDSLGSCSSVVVPFRR